MTKILSQNPHCNPACRACHYKDLDYLTQLSKKQAWAQSQLGQWGDALRPIIPAPPSEQMAYRSKSWLRAQSSPDGLSFGMERSIRRDRRWEKEFISWDTCPLHSLAIQQMIPLLREELRKTSHAFLESSLEGVWLGSPHVVIVSHTPLDDTVRALNWKSVLVAPFDQVWFHFNPQVGKKTFCANPIQLLFGNKATENPSAHPIRAFRQVAQTLLIQARESAVKSLLSDTPELVVDLYSGTGELSQMLPPTVNWLGLELSSDAVGFSNQLKPEQRSFHKAFVGTVEHRLADPRVKELLLGKIALFINPPRSGLSDQAVDQVLGLIEAHRPRTIAYLSCSASSLARDLDAIEPMGYRVESLQPFDFFPQTEHFETLALLKIT